MAVAVSSAAGLLSLLDEEDDALKLYALQSLNRVVHEFWFQIAGSIASVEAFYEDEGFDHRELAALVASKVASRTALEAARSSLLLWAGSDCLAFFVFNTVGVLLPWRAR
jgi:hypothetical protein